MATQPDRYFVHTVDSHDHEGNEIVEIFVLDREERNEVVVCWFAYNANYADCGRKLYWADLEATRLNKAERAGTAA